MTQPSTSTDDATSAEGRTFVILAAAAGFTAWELGFDWGAFENIDHRRFWAVWILCTVALVAGYLFPDPELERAWRFRWMLALPSIWLVTDLLSVGTGETITTILLVLSVVTLPMALYLIAELMVGDFFNLTMRSRVALIALVLVIFLVGLYVGTGNDRFLTCEDFERSGDFQPGNCAD